MTACNDITAGMLSPGDRIRLGQQELDVVTVRADDNGDVRVWFEGDPPDSPAIYDPSHLVTLVWR
jgi:hypothetical protein